MRDMNDSSAAAVAQRAPHASPGEIAGPPPYGGARVACALHFAVGVREQVATGEGPQADEHALFVDDAA